jgi:hypothetical protein
MRSFTILFAALALAACGGGSSSKTADAKPAGPDASTTPDAPGGGTPDAAAAGLTGLGQKCDPQANTCPSTSPDCVTVVQNGPYWCTPHCLDNGTGMTNAQGALTTVSPNPNNSCTTEYSGTVGSGACGIILSTTPADNPLKASTNYTGISLGCVVKCGTGDTCPDSMACQTLGQSKICIPK